MMIRVFLVLISIGASAFAEPAIRIDLDLKHPEKSKGSATTKEGAKFEFPVGFGRNGISPEGARFRGGSSLLGKFKVNAILGKTHFEMIPSLVKQSGKSEEFLRKQLFANMSSIDFDNDGKGNEYGAAFIGLEPLSKTSQPFGFRPYEGVFRWYSYAIHGTQSESRIGKKITGGCINVGAADLAKLVEIAKLGATVEIYANGSFKP